MAMPDRIQWSRACHRRVPRTSNWIYKMTRFRKPYKGTADSRDETLVHLTVHGTDENKEVLSIGQVRGVETNYGNSDG